jgi:acylphosphatase
VGLRIWAKRTAERLDLSGWIRNREDGTVEVNLAGSPGAVARFRQLLREGPRLARIVEVREKGPGQDIPEDDFEIRP